MIWTTLPIVIVDFIGSIVMIILSFGCVRIARRLNRKAPGNLIWTYLMWVSYFLAGFAVSRSVGHILKQILILTGYAGVWSGIRAFSGGVNTFMLIIVASITLFFERVWAIYQRMVNDKQALQRAHAELLDLNQNLERRVLERTEALAQSEKQLAQADKLASIGQLSSGIAHEINNPLGIILGYTQLLRRGEPPESQKHQDLLTIEKHVKTCKSIVEDLLNFARGSKPQKREVDIHEILDDVINFVQQHSKEAVTIERRYDTAAPKMRLDEKKIKQVILNLVMNARHAVAETDGTISLATAYDPVEATVTIRVKDTGYGIETNHISKIFDPFFTTKSTGEGTGLGLAVSYGIVKNHGGEIFVNSEAGKGAEFVISLPIEATAEATDV